MTNTMPPPPSPQVRRWHPFAETGELLAELRRRLLESASRAIEARARFDLVLAGGGTPCALYRSLIDATTDWQRWHIYFGDERCLPADDPQRNDRMAREAWLDHVPIPAAQIHAIPAERGATRGAEAYSQHLSEAPPFDLVLLGLGEDGHTASLFPTGRIVAAYPGTLAVAEAPKPPPLRISLDPQRLGQTRALYFMVQGSGKQEAVRRWRDNQPIPAATLNPHCGVDIFLDSAAAGSALAANPPEPIQKG